MLGDVRVKGDHAGRRAGRAAPRDIAHGQPGIAGATGDRAARLQDDGLAPEGAGQQALGFAEKGQHGGGRPSHGLGARHPGELLHRGVPADDRKPSVGDDRRVSETFDEAVSEVVHGPSEYI